MGDVLGPVIVAAVTSMVALVGALLGARQMQKMGLGDAATTVNKNLRELADTERAKRELADEEHDRDAIEWRQQLEAMTADRDRYRAMADDCDRRLNNAYAEMRATGRLTDRRSHLRGASTEGGDT